MPITATANQLFRTFRDLETYRRYDSPSVERVALLHAVSDDAHHRDLATALVARFSDEPLIDFSKKISSEKRKLGDSIKELADLGKAYLELRESIDASLSVLREYEVGVRMDSNGAIDLTCPIYIIGSDQRTLTAAEAIVKRLRQGGIELPSGLSKIIRNYFCKDGGSAIPL